MNNGIWNKERGPIGITGDTGPIGPAGPVFDGTTPLDELTVNGTSDLNGLTTIKATANDISFLQQKDGNTALEFRASTAWTNANEGGIFNIYNGLNEKVIALDGRSGSDTYFNSGAKFIIGSDTSISSDLLQVGSNTDISASIGRGKLGYNGVSDNFVGAHYDNMNTTDYGWRLTPSNTHINAKTSVFTRILDTTIISVTGSAISLLKPTTIDGGATHGILTLTGAATAQSQLLFGASDGQGVGTGYIKYSDNSDKLWFGTNSLERLGISTSGIITMPSMPTSDPSISGALWNDSGTVKISL